MNRRSEKLQHGALCSLVLLCSMQAAADELLRDTVRQQLGDENYVLVEDSDGARLFVFSTRSVSPIPMSDPEDETEIALAMTRSTDFRKRVRGLTLLSDVDSPPVLDAALVLLSDPVAAVREEAVHLLAEHPDADIDSIVALASNDPSERVRLVAKDLIEERLDDRGE